jgi:hypothetical protein
LLLCAPRHGGRSAYPECAKTLLAVLVDGLGSSTWMDKLELNYKSSNRHALENVASALLALVRLDLDNAQRQTATFSLLRALGLEDAARRSALQLMLLERRG